MTSKTTKIKKQPRFLYKVVKLSVSLKDSMDNLHVRLNVDLDKQKKIYHHSSKEHLKISKITKFGMKMLKNTENIVLSQS